jgi:Na+/H+ antiporter NhaD/arsenite permease-like protein
VQLRSNALGCGLLAVAIAGAPAAQASSDAHALGESLPLWSVLPFAGILLSIALFPLLRPRFWHHHYPKVALFWGLALAVPFLIAYHGVARHALLHVFLADYVPFVILLWALYTVAGGIVLRGTLLGTPLVNTSLLALGTLIASWVGTTGASMLLIRPLLRANAERDSRKHLVVFFIFLVSNIGGSLTPLGDPPLFLGFLRGVPFFWTLHLLPETLTLVAILLAVFYLLDRWHFRRETSRFSADRAAREPLRLAGAINIIWLLGIVGAVFASGVLRLGSVQVAGVELSGQNLLRDALLLGLGLLSLRCTPRALRSENGFGWAPMREVAILFAAIFATIVPALAILAAGERGQLAALVRAVQEPWHYFWMTGALSSFLDNAPTYLTFFSTALGRLGAGLPEAEALRVMLHDQPATLIAISAGAVFMGANTYIGNAPNFMVRSIAEEAGVAMPTFFGYIVRWSLPVLVPAFILLTLIFLR